MGIQLTIKFGDSVHASGESRTSAAGVRAGKVGAAHRDRRYGRGRYIRC
jgi:hypothetical protein